MQPRWIARGTAINLDAFTPMAGRCAFMPEPAKPFFKPFSSTPAPAAADGGHVTKSELTICAVAAGLTVPAERAAFLARACAGNDALRAKIEQQLAARVPTPMPAPVAVAAPAPAPAVAPTPAAAPASAPVPEAQLQRIPENFLTIPQNQPAGMALVPMSASQLAAITAQRTNTFPWVTAVLLAVAAGALGMLFMLEKDARQRADTARQHEGQRADTAALEAAEARAAAGKERETAAGQLTAARTETEKLRALADEQRLRAEAATRQAIIAKAEADRQRADTDAAAKDEAGPGKAALVKAEQERDAIRATQNETALAFADTLAKLAAAQLDGSRFAEAETSARRSLELRTAQSLTGWPLVESRALLGAALLQKNADAEAAREFAAAAADIERLGTPADDADRARLTLAARRIVQFHTATGRRKEGAELKRKYDALARP
jgi:hypothetical protein